MKPLLATLAIALAAISTVHADGPPAHLFLLSGQSNMAGLNPETKPHWKMVRKAHVAVAEADPRGAWVDTDDLNGEKNALHYSKPGYKTLGERFAKEAIDLIKAMESQPRETGKP